MKFIKTDSESRVHAACAPAWLALVSSPSDFITKGETGLKTNTSHVQNTGKHLTPDSKQGFTPKLEKM